MVNVSGGTFDMVDLSDAGPDEELPVHSVTIPTFSIGVYEVTFSEWDACFAAGGCIHNPNDGGWGRGRRPVINISWDDIQQYLSWINGVTGKNYRLPSESEWEYAARAGDMTDRWWGDQDPICADGLVRWARFDDDLYCDGIGTATVGNYGANAFGLYDVLGNAFEWTEDCRNEDYISAPNDGSAWTTGDCPLRIFRGGSWNSRSSSVRSAYRDGADTMYRQDNLGFRIVQHQHQ